jgi:hypothetical protein
MVAMSSSETPNICNSNAAQPCTAQLGGVTADCGTVSTLSIGPLAHPGICCFPSSPFCLYAPTCSSRWQPVLSTLTGK